MNDMITLVYTLDLEKSPFISECKEKNVNCIPVVDARSAVYVATGICAQNQRVVAVCVDAGNASRSAFSGMTEAFYRKLPVVLITIGKKLNYTKELNDVVVGHYIASNYADIQQLLNKMAYPMHIELSIGEKNQEKVECECLQRVLSSVLDENVYLYISQEIKKSSCQYKGKVVYGGMPGCSEGALANVLGASLIRKRKKYIGVVSENEFIHDINTIGNININDLICYIVIGNRMNKILVDYATAMQFEVITIREDQISDTEMRKVCLNDKKTFLMVYKEA